MESLIAFNILVLLAGMALVSMSRYYMLASQDELYQGLHYDLLLNMDVMKRDIHAAANVVAKAGPLTAQDGVLLLRRPRQDVDENILQDSFDFVSYRVALGGLIREVWPDLDAEEPSQSRMLSTNITTLAVLYGGKPSNQVDDFFAVNEIQVAMVSMRETGLRAKGSQDKKELDSITLDDAFPNLRQQVNDVLKTRSDVMLGSSVASAVLRNWKGLGQEE